MTMDIDSIDNGNVFEFLDWSQKNGIWDGREVDVLDAALLFRNDAEQNLLQLLFSKQSPAEFDRIAHALAQIGAGREIEEIDLSTTDAVPVGFKKSCSKFWKKHKTAILIGIAVVAIVTTIVVVSTVTGGAGAAGGGAALNAVCNEEEEKRKRKEKQPTEKAPSLPPPPSTPPPCTDSSFQLTLDNNSSFQKMLNPSDACHPPMNALPFSPMLPSPSDLLLVKQGVMKDGQYIKYREMLDQSTFERALSATQPIPQNTPLSPPNFFLPTFDRQSKIGRMFELMGDSLIDPDLKDPNIMPPVPNFSTRFTTQGPKSAGRQIGGINGVWNTLDSAKDHAQYLQKIAGNESIDWVHNQTHGMLPDLGEAVFLNRIGAAPNTADLLLKNWQEFHEANKDNPDATYLQFGHSQGTLQLREALYRAPQEIRDRIVVVAVAPATVIPDRLCRKAYNYVSSRDIVYLTDYTVTSFFSAFDTEYLELLRKDYQEIIWLEAHNDAPWFDHDFQSPTFMRVIERHIKMHQKGKLP